MAEVLQHSAAAQFAGISSAGASDVERGGLGENMIFPSPAGFFIKPAAAGVQALTMNSLRSVWTPVLAGLSHLISRRRKIRSLHRRVILSVGLVQNTGQATIASPCVERHAPTGTFPSGTPRSAGSA